MVVGGTAVAVGVTVGGKTPGMAGVGGNSPVGVGSSWGVGGGVDESELGWETAVSGTIVTEFPHAVSQNRAKRYNPATKNCPLTQTLTRKIILCPKST
jgi:hypothetical protein